ncbi:MAG: phage terminase large subunit [Oscillospiraceae bacterium]|nr:phage terminase large subunit [Oscillospiraceae bacterium]
MSAELKLPPPSEKQKLFLRDEHKYVGYGGARGGGKSWAVRVKAVLLCLRYAGIKVMIVRKTYPELQENHILPLCQMLGCYAEGEEKLADYHDGKKHIVFPNGSRILFRYLDNDRDALRFQGTEVDVLFVDEATQQSEENMEKLRACVRGVNDFPKRIYYTCNPGGEGHGWVKRLFIDRRFKAGEEPEEHSFIQALIMDNHALMKSDPDYIKRLEALPPKLRDAWLYGSWDQFEGQFFEDFRTEPDLRQAREHGCELSEEELKAQGRWCHVIAPLDLTAGARRGWSIVRSYDFGYGKPFSCAWWAVDYDGVIYRILELYGCTGTPNEGVRWTPDQQFREIARIEREHPWLRGKRIDGVADPAIWDSSRGESIAETAARYGLYFVPGDNNRIPGWMQCHYRLQFDNEGYSRMYVFEGCDAFIRTIPEMQYHRTIPEDLDSEREDHVADEWRYLCMSRPITPLRPTEEKSFFNDPLKR